MTLGGIYYSHNATTLNNVNDHENDYFEYFEVP